MPRKYNFRRAYNGKNARRGRARAGRFAGSVARAAVPVIAGGIASNYLGPGAGAMVGTGVRAAMSAYPRVRKYLGSGRAGSSNMQSNHIRGHGDYVVGRGVSSHYAQHKPHVQKMEKGAMCIEHTEYIGDLISSATANTFLSQSYAINPANSGTYPWMSSVAVNFQEYRFKKLVFEYRPLVSESSSSAAGSLLSMGSIMMATQYNSVVGPYTTKATMAESDYSVTVKPSEHALHAVECDVKYNPLGVLYCSPNLSLTTGTGQSDIRMANLGIFEIASTGIPTGGVAIDLGEIWVHYEVELYKPQLNSGLSAIESAHYWGSTATGSPATTTPFGPNVTSAIQPIAAANNLLSLTFTTTAFSFPLAVTTGQFLFMLYIRGTAAAVQYNAPTVANGSLITAWNSGVLNASQSANNPTGPQSTLAGATQCCIFGIVQVNAPGSALCSVTFPTTVVPTAGQFDLVVTPYNSLMA